MLSIAEVQSRRAAIDKTKDGMIATMGELELFRDVLAEIEKGWEGHVSKLARAALRPPRGKS